LLFIDALRLEINVTGITYIQKRKEKYNFEALYIFITLLNTGRKEQMFWGAVGYLSNLVL
jgi:hypothetical protein